MPPVDTVLRLESCLHGDFVKVVWDTSKINNEIKYNFIDFLFPKMVTQQRRAIG